MLSVGALGGVAATSVSFTNQEVPKYQEYAICLQQTNQQIVHMEM